MATSSGVNNIAGMASGIDTEALIAASTNASTAQRVQPKQDKVTELQGEDTALGELKTKLTSLKSIVDSFSTINGGGVARQALSSDETVLTATASNAAASGAYTVAVSQLARNGSMSMISTNRNYTSTTSVINPDINNGAAASPNRTVSYTLGTGSNTETVNITLTNTSTLSEFVTSFNSQSTLATASLVNRGTASSPDYILMVSSKYQGTEKGSVVCTVGSEVQTAGNPGGGAFDGDQSSVAQDAKFTLNGSTGTITRSSNIVNDVLTGVTLSLTSTGSAIVTVGTDNKTTEANVQKYVDAYNDIVSFLAGQNQITRQDDGTNVSNTYGPLAKTKVDEDALEAIRQVMASTVATSGRAVRIFADLGVTTQRDGTLALDTKTLDGALDTESDSVSQVLNSFGDTAGLTGGTIDQFLRYNGLIDMTVNGNETTIADLNDQISRAQSQISKQATELRSRYARLESTMSQMQSQQSSLKSLLG